MARDAFGWSLSDAAAPRRHRLRYLRSNFATSPLHWHSDSDLDSDDALEVPGRSPSIEINRRTLCGVGSRPTSADRGMGYDWLG